MKLEELIKKVIKLNKLNKELCINKKYVVILLSKFKTFEFEKLYFGEIERYWVDTVVDKLKTCIFERFDCNNSWQLEINTENERLFFDLFVLEKGE